MKNDPEQMSFIYSEADKGPVVCLGMTFESEEARREYFRNKLRTKLSELKKMEGFPLGSDEDIIALSDPPYYTVCPNPWINDFIKEWEEEKVEKFNSDLVEDYSREPFVADVSEGKNDPIYTAHSYHTKVPHEAIMRYILHFTKPGDIILDGFSGSGMTGIASQMVSEKESVLKLGYMINGQNEIIDTDTKEVISKLGSRKAILNDLSPAATFISYNYNYYSNVEKERENARTLLKKVRQDLGWMFETQHQDLPGAKGNILYTVFSDVFICGNCSNEIIFWDAAVNHEKGNIEDQFKCPNCQALVKKRTLQKAWVTNYDNKLGESVTITKQVPVLIQYEYKNKRYQKRPDSFDIELIDRINNMEIPTWFPSDEIFKGDKTIEPIRLGIKNIHQYYTKRNLFILSSIFDKCNGNMERFLFTGMLTRSSKQARFLAKNFFHGGGGWVGTSLSGTLFFPSLSIEVNPLFTFENRVEKMLSFNKKEKNLLTTQSTGNLKNIKENSIDYIFTDPPFGNNLIYSELNFNTEAWLKVKTNNSTEAIMSKAQNKEVHDYEKLISECFKEYFRVLKSGRWITIEFSNSQAKVWNAIQDAIQKAGFIIANVSALNKKQGSFNAVTSTTAVKQDLVISAYKPKQENIEKIKQQQNTEESAWTFIAQHLEQLPVFIGNKGEAQIIAERTPRILFDRMIAYHVQNGLQVPISSAEFQMGIAQRFNGRDGMFFLDRQVAEYDKKRILAKEFSQLSLFVSDETSAIEWIRQQIMKKPQTRQDIHPNFMKEIQHISKHELLPELDDLLHQNFLRYDGDEIVPDQIASYLRKNYKDLRGLEAGDAVLIDRAKNRWYVPDPNKQADLEKLREKSLLREFDSYIDELESSKKKLKQFRTEAIRAGFKKAYSEKDFEKIVNVGDRLPESVIQEDDKLLMYYDNACIRLGL